MPMMSELSAEIAHHSIQALSKQGQAEGAGIDIAIRLSRSPYLTSVERDFAWDILRNDEVAHLRWCRSASNYLSGVRMPGYGAWQRKCNQALIDALPFSSTDLLRRDQLLLLHLRQI